MERGKHIHGECAQKRITKYKSKITGSAGKRAQFVLRFLRSENTGANHLPRFFRATLAQLVEQHFRKVKVPGSNPGGGSKGINVGREFKSHLRL